MPVEKAKKYFIGADGYKKMNCAQAVLGALSEKLELSMEQIENFSAFGGGRAPGGLCGAIYAAKYIMNEYGLGEQCELDALFEQTAGSLMCHEIRGGKKLSCLGCVEKSVEFLTKQD